MTPTIVYPAADEPRHRIRPDLLGTVIPAEHATLVRWAVPAGQPETPLHSHDEFEQVTVILAGRIKTTVDAQVFTLSPGDVLRIPRGAVHGNTVALGGTAAMILDIFMPPRPQYLEAAARSA